MPHQNRLNIAVFIDFDNIEIGVKNTLNEHFDVGTVLDAIKERGEVVTKVAYADWTRAGEYSRSLTQHAIRLVQRNLTPGGDKNGADINLALDALEMVFTHQHINAYVIVGGDSDFLSLVEKLKQYDKKVFVVGGRAFTSVILQRNCHEFVAYENLIRRPAPVAKGARPAPATSGTAPIAQTVPLLRRALKILADREVSPQTGLLKSTLLQLDSTFSERSYGASSFLDFVEKLSQAGIVQLKHAGRSVMVELNEGFDDSAAGAPAAQAPQATLGEPAFDAGVPGAAPQMAPQPVAATEPAADGVRLVGQMLRNATGARWPMYLRNVKQILRAANGGFDERRYGFNGLMDLLRACQREGLVRMERDRRGGLRVFQGQALGQGIGQTAGRPAPEPPAIYDVESDVTLSASLQDEPIAAHEAIEAEPPSEPIPIDTTAELLGRAKPRRPRTRAQTAAPVARKTAARKPAAPRRSARSRKPAAESGDNSD